MSGMSTATATFTGFGTAAHAWFAGLAANQNRAWFQANRDRYEREVRQPFIALIADLNQALAARDVPCLPTQSGH